MSRRPAPIVFVAAALLVVSAAPAHGASRLVVRGAGFGHGVGMSQYGAYGYAKRGYDHRFILRHYYSDTQVGKLSGPGEVRVLLRRAGRMTFSGSIGVAGGRRLSSKRTYVASRALGGAVTLRSASGRSLGTYRAPLRVIGSSKGVRLRGRAENSRSDGRYRGDLELRPSALGMTAINAIRLEDYLRGVVAGEVPASWPVAALRAQAVAARTYAITTSKNGAGFDQYADTRSQMYLGISGEHARTNAAVAATDGEVVVHDGKAVVTYYFSTSGGRTENVENSFIGADPQPWLRSVTDPYDGASPRHRWTVRMSLGRARAKLGGLLKGSLRQIRVLRRGNSPRVVRAQIVGTRGRRSVSGPQLRSRLGLDDTWARFTVITASAKRGDGNTPKSSGDPDPAPSGGPSTGGSTPSAARAAGANGLVREMLAGVASSQVRVAGAISGRVAPARAGRSVAVERREGRRWRTVASVRTTASGRYSATVADPGRYRVRFDGVAGPTVRVR